MRVLFVCDTMDSGGAERVISILSNGFCEHNIEVTILMLSKGADVSFYKLNNGVQLLSLSHLDLRPFKKVRLLREKIRTIDPDIVISFLSYVCIYTWLALSKTNIPYIVSERNDPNHRGKLKQFLLNQAFKKAKGCVFQTEDALKWYKKIVKSEMRIIYNPVKLDFTPHQPYARKQQVLYVGRFSDQKNLFMLIDAFEIFISKHNDFILKMYGKGELEQSIKLYIERKGLCEKIQVLPSSNKWQRKEFDSKIFVLSSKFEGMPNVLAEALCLGIPSVSTNCTIGGPKELKKFFPNELILSETPVAESFANAMEESLLINDFSPRVPKGLRDWVIVNQWLDFIDKIVKYG